MIKMLIIKDCLRKETVVMSLSKIVAKDWICDTKIHLDTHFSRSPLADRPSCFVMEIPPVSNIILYIILTLIDIAC